MMEGLIVKQPYAELIINGEKEWELRSRCPPSKKLSKELYLLSAGTVLGKIKIDTHFEANKNDLEKNKNKHRSETSFLSEHHVSYVWKVQVIKKFSKPKKYIHPTGARVWVNNVSFKSQPSILNFV